MLTEHDAPVEEPEVKEPSPWLEPFTWLVCGVTLLFLVLGAIAFGVFDGDDPNPVVAEPDGEDDPVPTPVFPDPNDPNVDPEVEDLLEREAPSERFSIERPPVVDLVSAADRLFGWAVADDGDAIVAATSSQCPSTGGELVEAVSGVSPSFAEDGYLVALVVTPNIGLVVPADAPDGAQMLFYMDSGVWVSGFCADPAFDLGQSLELREDLAKLAGIDFSGEVNQGQYFEGDFTFAVFDDANMSESAFQDAFLDGSSFVNTNLALTWFGFTSSGPLGVDFTGAILDDTTFVSADFRNSSFVDASMRRADLFGSNFEGADFSGADLTDADLNLNDIEGWVGWEGTICPDGEIADVADGCRNHL